MAPNQGFHLKNELNLTQALMIDPDILQNYFLLLPFTFLSHNTRNAALPRNKTKSMNVCGREYFLRFQRRKKIKYCSRRKKKKNQIKEIFLKEWDSLKNIHSPIS